MNARRVVLDQISKSFGAVRVLESLSLAIEPGEFLVLLGASGCGKTTALRIVAGLESASAGKILIGDRDVTEPRRRHGLPVLCPLPPQDRG